MRNPEFHVSDEELLLLGDGELAPAPSAEIRRHLEACWTCRTRMTGIEATIADFVHIHHADLDPQLPPVAGPRALLKIRLAEAAAASGKETWFGRLLFAIPVRPLVFACGVLVLVVSGMTILRYEAPSHNAPVIELKAGLIPKSDLTPGAIRPVTRKDICAAGYRDMNRAVPLAVQQEIFKAYGLAGARAKDFEMDYLITPELGGADNIKNLWPEPYSSTDWDARVKDALESRLHQMVCEGKIDLATAQREMASDWISAYKKYFHTDRPLSIDSANPREKPESEIEGGKST